MEPIPFVDLTSEWAALKLETLARVEAVFDHGRFVMGPEIEELEGRLAEMVGVRHAIACASGTTALLMAMMALEIGPGDEVVVPAYTFAAPAECALLLGASPVFVDVATPSGLVDVDRLKEALTPRTRAIVAVSLYGAPPDFSAINALADAHGIAVIEDAAQSFGGCREGRQSGSLARLGCTSFFPTKVLGGAGDGGAVFTDDDALAGFLAEIRDHGQSGKYRHVRTGVNGRMSSIAAAALLVRLKTLKAAIGNRRAVADTYDALLSDARRAGRLDFAVPDPCVASARSQYALLVENRDRVATDLREAGIQTAVHYPEPLHLQPAFSHARRSGPLSGASRMAEKVLCLPIYPGLAASQVARVAEAVLRSLK
ncbi:DegT/DnrJ/EryC1/StrS family aminotransferase [Stappia sp.]|uniref:DegT/DnrJ/EryC1/StrS family aminotransferase n=1 Tax=Stappia sp. TaxID=1870903 RepID=UPI003D09FFF9